MKRCSRCGLDKEPSEFGRNKARPDGLQGYCNPCRRVYDKEWREEKNPESARVSQEKYEESGKKDVAVRSYREKNREAILKRGRLHHSLKSAEEKREHYLRGLSWRREHPKEYKEMQKRYSSKPGSRKIRAATQQRLYWRSPEKYRGYVRKWLSNNRAYRRINQQRRVARLAEVENDYDREDWERTLEVFDRMCVYCFSKEDLVMDHFIPISLGGPNIPTNVVVACRSCNSKKKDRHPLDWVVRNLGQDCYDWIMEVLGGPLRGLIRIQLVDESYP